MISGKNTSNLIIKFVTDSSGLLGVRLIESYGLRLHHKRLTAALAPRQTMEGATSRTVNLVMDDAILQKLSGLRRGRDTPTSANVGGARNTCGKSITSNTMNHSDRTFISYPAAFVTDFNVLTRPVLQRKKLLVAIFAVWSHTVIYIDVSRRPPALPSPPVRELNVTLYLSLSDTR
ncbi:hypothetical protein J6590_055850 [Homalodisca vitripennis]|nr:hypothetical protein J6590_055850 [Homalodisca vitripennis]